VDINLASARALRRPSLAARILGRRWLLPSDRAFAKHIRPDIFEPMRACVAEAFHRDDMEQVENLWVTWAVLSVRRQSLFFEHFAQNLKSSPQG
jgi:hypothetical protein